MKALLLHHPYSRPRFEQDFLHRVDERACFDLAPADLAAFAEGDLSSSNGALRLSDYDSVIIFVAFPNVLAAAPLQWKGYAGLRVMLEHDAIQNYSDIFKPEWTGAWPPVLERHRFDLIVTTGGAVKQRFANDGIAAEWLPKAFEPTRFADLEGPRAGIVTYGSAYRCRIAAERALTEAGLPLTRLPMTPYPDLGAALSRHLACMAVSSDLLAPLSQRDQLVHAAPPQDIAIRPGLEPMAKFFEGAGAGCCPVSDDMDDLKALGFLDGETVVTFRSHAELVERLGWWFDRPDALRDLGRAAAKLAHAHHTWAHRAGALEDILMRWGP